MRLPHDDLMRLLPGLSFAVVVQLAVTAVIAAPVDTLLECAARDAPATEGLADPSARRQASHSRQVPRQIAIGVHGRQRLGEGCVPLPAQIGDGLCKRLPTGCA